MADKLDVMRANVDDEYKLMDLRAREYRDIIAEYKNTSDAYYVSNDINDMRCSFDA